MVIKNRITALVNCTNNLLLTVHRGITIANTPCPYTTLSNYYTTILIITQFYPICTICTIAEPCGCLKLLFLRFCAICTKNLTYLPTSYNLGLEGFTSSCLILTHLYNGYLIKIFLYYILYIKCNRYYYKGLSNKKIRQLLVKVSMTKTSKSVIEKIILKFSEVRVVASSL